MTTPPDNLILFDGLCNLCNSAVRFIIRHDKDAVFRFAPIQSERGRSICRSCGLDPDDVQTFVYFRDGRSFVRSDAALEVAVQIGGTWRLLAVLRLVPAGARDWLYALISQNRYRWFGRHDKCLIPAEEVERRFLR